MHFSICGLLKIVCVVLKSCSQFFSPSLSSSLSCEQTAFKKKKVHVTPVLHLSSNFLFSTFVAAYRIALGCAAMFFLFTARPPLCVVWPFSKDNGEAV